MTNPLVEMFDGFPIFQQFTLGKLQDAEVMAFTSVYPNLYFMIKHFGIAEDDSHIATYSGYLGAAYLLGEYISSLYWVKASNKYGRKTILLYGLASTAFSLLIFGFSTNFYMALLARFFMGLCGGKSQVYRNTMEEIALEGRHKHHALTSLSQNWTSGILMGYFFGGLSSLSYKSDIKYDGLLLSKYPFLLSNLIIISVIVAEIIMGWLFLEETHEQIKYVRDIGLEKGDSIRRMLGFQVPERPWQLREQDPKVDQQPFDDNMKLTERHVVPYQIRNDLVYTPEELSTDTETYEEFELVRSLATWNRIINNYMLCFQNTFFFEFFPIFLASPLREGDLKFPFQIKGGFSYNAYGIGMLTFLAGYIGSVFEVPLSIIRVYFGRKCVAGIALLVYPITYFLLPLYLFTLHEYNKGISKSLANLLLVVNISVVWLFKSFTFPLYQSYFDISSSKEQRRPTNSYSIRFITLAKCATPIIGGWMISIFDAQGYGGTPWWILSVWSTMTLLHSIYIDRRSVALA